MRSLFREIWEIFISPGTNCDLFPIYSRISIYGFLLMGILYLGAEKFDSNEVLTVIMFTSLVSVVELLFKKSKVKINLLWHFGALLLLVALLASLLQESTSFRAAWYRTHVLENHINMLITDVSAQPIISVNSGGNIKVVNQAASNLIGWTQKELVGKSLAVLMRPEKYAIHKKAFDEVIKRIESTHLPQWVNVGDKIFKLIKKDGTSIDVHILIIAVPFEPRDEGGQYPVGESSEVYAIITVI